MQTTLRVVQGTKPRSGKRDYINHQAQLEPKTGVLFTDFIERTVARKAKRMGQSYQSGFRTLINHIKCFSAENDAAIFTNSVNEDFLDDFILYLQDLNLRQNYIKGLIEMAKSMVKKAGTYGFAVDSSYDDVNVKEDDPFAVYLSMNEISRIYFFRGLTHKQERIRDLFVVGCLTALRYSDYSTLTSDNFQGDYIVKMTKKTGKKVIIPMHDYVKLILEKYEGNINFGISIQHFNRYIKKIMEKMEFNTPITYSFIRGGKMITETKQKWEMISSHTARRSAATNMHLTGRMKTTEIMQITGHTTESSFFRYIKTSTEDRARQIAGDTFFRV